MATDLVLPLYDVLVENIFGSIGMAIIGVALALFLILALCRVSSTFIMYWFMFYFMVMGTMYLGALGLVLGFIVIGMFAIVNILRVVIPDR